MHSQWMLINNVAVSGFRLRVFYLRARSRGTLVYLFFTLAPTIWLRVFLLLVPFCAFVYVLAVSLFRYLA